jgi:N-acetylglucosaminyldiphosphoundecaprenol N-acetyl-beta-D-mannosaminyltransferase
MEHVDFFGLKVSNFTKEDFRNYIINSIKTKRKTVIYGYSLGLITQFKINPEIYTYANKFNILVIDGTWFLWLLKMYHISIKFVISIPQTVYFLLDLANQNGYSIMLVGADANTNTRAESSIRSKYPLARIISGVDGYFTDENIVLQRINKERPDIIFLGISSPKKEKLATVLNEKSSSVVIVPCGGMIDVLSGKVKSTPTVLKVLGLATIVRVLQEPKRLLRRNLWEINQIFFKLFPKTIYNTLIKRNSNFKIHSIFIKDNEKDLG